MPVLYYVPSFHLADDGKPDTLRMMLGGSPHSFAHKRHDDAETIAKASRPYWTHVSATLQSIFINNRLYDDAQNFRVPVHLYVDAFCSEVPWENFVRAFYRGHRMNVIRALVHRGATVEWTEEVSCYHRWMTSLEKLSGENRATPDNVKHILANRDQFMANRVTETLKGNSVGIMFAGAAHEVPKHLPPVIETRVVHRADVLPEKAHRAVTQNELLAGRFAKPDSYRHQAKAS